MVSTLQPVRVLTLASKGTIDEWILKRAGEKKLIDNKVIQAGMFNNQSSMEDRQELLQDIMQCVHAQRPVILYYLLYSSGG